WPDSPSQVTWIWKYAESSMLLLLQLTARFTCFAQVAPAFLQSFAQLFATAKPASNAIAATTSCGEVQGAPGPSGPSARAAGAAAQSRAKESASASRAPGVRCIAALYQKVGSPERRGARGARDLKRAIKKRSSP